MASFCFVVCFFPLSSRRCFPLPSYLSSHALAVVCDGHGGAKCSEYVSKNLPRVLSKACDEQRNAEGGSGGGGGDVLASLVASIATTEANWCTQAKRKREPSGACLGALVLTGHEVVRLLLLYRVAVGWLGGWLLACLLGYGGKLAAYSRTECWGSCDAYRSSVATLAHANFLSPSPQVAANVGDCRVVCATVSGEAGSRSLEVAQLTLDHRCVNCSHLGICPGLFSSKWRLLTRLVGFCFTFWFRSTDKAERDRIAAAGGFVRNRRVFGVLEPSRSMGECASVIAV